MSVLNNMKIGFKIGLSFGLVGLLFIIVIIQYQSSFINIQSSYDTLLNEEEAEKSLSSDIAVAMLQARRSEKDFFSRLDLKYVDSVEASVDTILIKADEIKNILENSGEDSGAVNNIIKEITTYREGFLKVVEANKVKGLDYESGLQGEFRASSHSIEAELEEDSDPDVMVNYLTLRKHEKDYLLRLDVKYVTKVDDTLDELLSSIEVADFEDEHRLAMLELVEEYKTAFHHLVEEDSEIVTLIAEMTAAVHKIEPLIEENLSNAIAGMLRITEEIKTETDSRTLIALTTSLVAVLLSVILAVVIVLSITRPVREILKFIKNYGDGDLTATISIDSKDEIGTMALSLQEAITTLLNTIMQVNVSSNNVESGSAQLSDSANQMSQGASEQASSIEEISSSMEEMVSNIKRNADNASQTEKIARKSAGDAEIGGKAVTNTVEAMKKIAAKINVIEEIARNTNLLALNASIEAARAGEYGKGFAVVASEVGKLAERSQLAASEINTLASDSVQVAEKAGETIMTMIPDIQKTSELIQEISASSNEQNSGAEQINQAIMQLDKVIQQNAAASEESSSMAEELNSQSVVLKDAISFFKIEQSQDSGHKKQITPQLNVSSPIKVSNKPKTLAQSSNKGLDISLDGDENYAEYKDQLDNDYVKM